MNKELEQIIANSDSVMGEVMRGGDRSNSGKFRDVHKEKGTKKSRSDIYLRVCDKCNYVWEREFSTWRLNSKKANNVKYICKYEEITRYGKPVETCYICLGEPNIEERKIY